MFNRPKQLIHKYDSAALVESDPLSPSEEGSVVMSPLIRRILCGVILLTLVMISLPDFTLPSTSGPIQGEVVTVTVGIPGTMVIRDEKGQLHILKLTQQTQLSAQFKPGDKVLAFTGPYGVSAVQLQTGTP